MLIGKYEVSVLQQSAMQAAAAGPCPSVDAAGRQVQGRVAWQDAARAAAHWSNWLERHAEAEHLSAGRRNEVPPYGPEGVIRAPDNGYRLVLDRAPGAVAPVALASGLTAPGAARTLAGHLQINVDVASALSLDGRGVGTAAPGAPLVLTNLAVGEYRLELLSEGYTRVQESHRVDADRWTQVTVAMQPRMTGPEPQPEPEHQPPTEQFPGSAPASGADARTGGAVSLMELLGSVVGVALMIWLALMIWGFRLMYVGQRAQSFSNPTRARASDSPGSEDSMWSTNRQYARQEAPRLRSSTKPCVPKVDLTLVLSRYIDA
ncbi:PEGA domain-containing protein [Thiocapsa marina]|uniref:PEGA domain protein n=1 Tax=Thiocapsa marina 5811 TaxID=768671 RepID=F9UHR4_9GAMM|nr:PEGA domain-containing protein [Thiocapsa marina]EGV16240.1 PEGA domain protein [Thiocapsa marina 5811]